MQWAESFFIRPDRILAESVPKSLTCHSPSCAFYNQPEGGILSGNGVFEDTLSLFMVQAVIIITVTRVLALGTKWMKQPRVIMEVLGGIILGPSVLGHIPGYMNVVFPTESLGYISLVANLGLVLYLFLVGVELDPEVLKQNGKKAITIAGVGIAFPFALGASISPLLYNLLLITDPGYEQTNIGSFIVFVGVAMSITAFPVLARILTESKLILSTAGVMTMGAAALNDAIAWCLLVLALSIVHAGHNKLTALFVFLAILGYAVALFLIVRPALQKIVRYVEQTGSSSLRSLLFAFLICCIFLSSWITAFLGVHAIFGSFLVGMIMPRECKFTHNMCEKIDDLVSSIFLPLYFALSGLKTDIGSVKDAMGVGMLILVVCMATAGKFIGCAGTARLNGIPWRESAVIGVLMNTRGLVELIVLNLGLQAHILNVEIFTILVMMALITTIMTSPIVEYIYPPGRRMSATMGELKSSDSDVETTDYDAEVAEIFVPGEEKDVEMMKMGGPMRRMRPKMRHEGSAERLRESLAKRTWRVGAVIEKMKDLPETMSLLYLFAPVYSNNSKMDVTAMHFVDTDLRSTDMMLAAHPEKASAMDPCLLAINYFCRAVGAEIGCHTLFGNPNDFASDLIAMEKKRRLDIVLMPWRRPVHYLGDYYDRFISKTLRDSTITVALLVPDPSGKTDMVRTVLVILTGCPSDADCIALASRFALHSLVSITVMVMPDAFEQTDLFADLSNFGPGSQYDNVHVIKLEALDPQGHSRPSDSILEDVLKEASKRGEHAYDLIVTGHVKFPVEDDYPTYSGSQAPSRSASPPVNMANTISVPRRKSGASHPPIPFPVPHQRVSSSPSAIDTAIGQIPLVTGGGGGGSNTASPSASAKLAKASALMQEHVHRFGHRAGTSSFGRASSLGKSKPTRIPEFGLVGEAIYLRRDFEAYMMIVRGFQPTLAGEGVASAAAHHAIGGKKKSKWGSRTNLAACAVEKGEGVRTPRASNGITPSHSFHDIQESTL